MYRDIKALQYYYFFFFNLCATTNFVGSIKQKVNKMQSLNRKQKYRESQTQNSSTKICMNYTYIYIHYYSQALTHTYHHGREVPFIKWRRNNIGMFVSKEMSWEMEEIEETEKTSGNNHTKCSASLGQNLAEAQWKRAPDATQKRELH